MEIQLPATDPFAASKRSLTIKNVLITSLIAIVLVTGVFLYTRSRQSSLLIQAPTSGVTVKLNGTTVAVENDKQGLKVPVIAGQYRLEIDRTNYLPFIQDVTIPVGESLTVRPVFTLMPITAEQAAGGGISFVRPVPSRNLVFYLGDGGTRLYRVDTATQTQIPISEQSISRITDVEWPSEADVAIITRPDGTYLFEPTKFDFQNQRFERVAGSEVLSPVWDPNADRVAAALFMPNGERSLVLSDKRFTNMERKAALTGFTNPRLIWSPDSRYIGILNHSTDPSQNNLWIYTLADGSLSAVTSGGGIVDATFSLDERAVILQRTANQLAIHTLSSGEEKPVGVAGTAALVAWRDAQSFYLPEPGSNALVLHTLSGSSTRIPYTLPSTAPITGMFYFRQSESLVFYTEKAVYTVSLAQ
jgi:hypothetical protein